MTPSVTLELRIARAFEIADESMEALMRAHTLRCDEVGHLLKLVDEDGEEVATLAEADAGTQDAFAWLSERGLCELIDEPGGEVILMVNET